MRRIRKSWPPGNVSPDGQPACTFADAERDYLAALPAAANPTAFARARFDQLDKAKLRQAMYQEQRSICVYCERRIQDGHPVPRTDHWKPLCRYHKDALCWKNLYLSCSMPETCDNAKKSNRLAFRDADPDLPWPADFAYENVLGFTSDGEVYVRKDAVLDEANRNALELAIDDRQDGPRKRAAILNLNHQSLMAARRAALDSERTRLQKDFRGKTISREDRNQRASDLLAGNPLPQFVSIRVAWLRKMLGKGR